MNQIPLGDLFSYIQHFDLVGTKEEFIHIIQKMDEAFLEHFNRERDKARKKNG